VIALAMILTFNMRPSETIYCYVNGEPVTDIAVAQRQVAMISRIASSGEKAALANVEMIEQTAAKGDVANKAFKYLKLIETE
jgi:hypothetical protein